jgi:hypothetical protein
MILSFLAIGYISQLAMLLHPRQNIKHPGVIVLTAADPWPLDFVPRGFIVVDHLRAEICGHHLAAP